MNKQIIKKFGMDVRTVSYLRQYCSCVPKFLAFETSHGAHILGFGVPNAKYLAFGTPDENALRCYSSPRINKTSKTGVCAEPMTILTTNLENIFFQ